MSRRSSSESSLREEGREAAEEGVVAELEPELVSAPSLCTNDYSTTSRRHHHLQYSKIDFTFEQSWCCISSTCLITSASIKQ